MRSKRKCLSCSTVPRAHGEQQKRPECTSATLTCALRLHAFAPLSHSCGDAAGNQRVEVAGLHASLSAQNGDNSRLSRWTRSLTDRASGYVRVVRRRNRSDTAREVLVQLQPRLPLPIPCFRWIRGACRRRFDLPPAFLLFLGDDCAPHLTDSAVFANLFRAKLPDPDLETYPLARGYPLQNKACFD